MSSIQAAKVSMRYTGIAPEGAQCQTCKFAAPSDAIFAGRYHCARGGFFVAGVAGCAERQPKREVPR